MRRLLGVCFGTRELPLLDHHVTLSAGGGLVGHAAFVPRQITLGRWSGTMFLLGLVAVDPSWRHQGAGTSLVIQAVEWAKAAGSAGVLLNCGASLVGFYERAGFRRIADRAGYLRGGRVVVDEDPVMLHAFVPLEPGFFDSVALGADF